jgi:hypothetical protein
LESEDKLGLDFLTGLDSFLLNVINDVLFFLVINKFFLGRHKSSELRSIGGENIGGSISFDGLDSNSEKELNISGKIGKSSKELKGLFI